jgi:hypothetical protein
MSVLFVLGCGKRNAPSEARFEEPIPESTPQAEKAPEPAAPTPPPTASEVIAALRRVFGDDLIIDRSSRPAFIAGDFNGDTIQDLAVIVRVAPGKLPDINSELANWTIQDADHFFVPSPDKSVVAVPVIAAAKITEGEEVLAIIHGVGREGWRNPAARQAYLVKHAAASLLGTSPSVAQKSIRAMRLPVESEIIHELRRNRKGFIFWTGSQYAWHPAKG